MKPKRITSKPIRPSRMWAHRSHPDFGCTALKGHYFTRPVLVIDLSPESVEALIEKVSICTHKRSKIGGNTWNGASPSIKELIRRFNREDLAAIGIKPAKGGRK